MKIALSGCFDLFHDGHKHLLNEAIKLAFSEIYITRPQLIICLNTDESIKELKGISRPIEPYYKRKQSIEKYLFEVLRIEDYKSDFFLLKSFTTEKELLDIYRNYRPGIIVHGDDIKDMKKVTGYGEFAIELIPRLPGFSTTEKLLSSRKIKHYIAENEEEYTRAGVTEFPAEVIEKVWGTEEIVINTAHKYCIKIMTLRPEHQVSMHWHSHKKETFILIKGNLTIETVNTQTGLNQTTILTEPLSSFTLEPDVPHTFYTEGREDVVFIEGSTYDDPYDSYRIFPSRRRYDEE